MNSGGDSSTNSNPSDCQWAMHDDCAWHGEHTLAARHYASSAPVDLGAWLDAHHAFPVLERADH